MMTPDEEINKRKLKMQEINNELEGIKELISQELFTLELELRAILTRTELSKNRTNNFLNNLPRDIMIILNNEEKISGYVKNFIESGRHTI